MTFLNELERSKTEQVKYDEVYNQFSPGGATGPSGPGGGSWHWIECGKGSKISDETEAR